MVAALLAVLVAPGLAVASTAPATAIKEFRTAWQRVADGQPDQPDPPELKHLAIYPYLVAARLSRDLANTHATQADPHVATFLTTHGGEPVTRKLTRNWMQSLARRKAWPEFLAHYVPARSNNKLRCQRYTALIKTGKTQGLASAIKKTYMTGRTRPACATAFDWLQAQGQLQQTTIQARARLALKDGNATLARYLARQLPATIAAPIKRNAAFLTKPEASLKDAIAHPQQAIAFTYLYSAFSGLARRHPEHAVALYPQLLEHRKFTEKHKARLTRILALGLAWDRRPEALHYFKKLGPVHHDKKVEQWRIRAALWSRQWKQARAWLASLPPSLTNQPQWLYWTARTEEQAGNIAKADKIYGDLSASNGYYGVLAGWRTGKGYAPDPAPLVDTPKLEKPLLANPGIIRAHELFRARLPQQAGLEWRIALANTTPDEHLQAVWLAHRWGWYAQSIATAARQGVFAAYHLLYPRPYPKAIKTASKDTELPENWIYGVIRQESLYNAHAVSRSGALGLMQLMPGTARAVARRNELDIATTRTALFRPRANLVLGTTHLRELMDRENDSFIVALASYNAGVHAAEHWLPDKPMAADIWIENVPYNETRKYIKRILWHVAVFNWVSSGKRQNISTLMAPIGPGG